MLQIVDYIVYKEEFYFFAEGSEEAFTESVICRLADAGVTNVSVDDIKKITKKAA